MKRGYGYLLVCASLSACAALTDLGSIAPSPADAGARACIAGETQACVGAGACAGGQACKADGAGYEACVCGSPPEFDGSADAGDAGVTDSAMSVDGGDGSAPPGMVSIPGHTFPDGGAIAAFYMDKTEVTVSAYAACVSAGKCMSYTDANCNAGVQGRDNHPINCVDWNQSTAYCAWAGKRLPTEEEWQYAADAADGRVYPWGNTAPDTQLCWSGSAVMLDAGTKRTSTCVVGSFPTGDSPFGLSDMSGNVWEWTSSAYDSQTPMVRVFRGGSFDYADPSNFRAASRAGGILRSSRLADVGFRCSR